MHNARHWYLSLELSPERIQAFFLPPISVLPHPVGPSHSNFAAKAHHLLESHDIRGQQLNAIMQTAALRAGPIVIPDEKPNASVAAATSKVEAARVAWNGRTFGYQGRDSLSPEEIRVTETKMQVQWT
jgi:hypothetical protein